MVTRREWLSQVTLAALGSAMAGASPLVLAQSNVTKVIVGFQAGGGFDALARITAEQLSKLINKTIIVENKPGAAGGIAVDTVVKAKPNGDTLLITPAPVLTMSPHTISTSISFDPLKDIVVIARLASFDYGFAVSSELNINTLDEYREAVKKNPKLGTFGSPGFGLTPHLVGEIFAKESGIELLHVAYKGTAPALQDVMGNQIPAICATAPALAAGHDAGRIRVLATTGLERNPDLPNVPTFTELGFNNLHIEDWAVLAAPAGTSQDIVKTLSDKVLLALENKELQDKLKQQGFYTAGLGSKEAGQLLASDFESWKVQIEKLDFKNVQ